MKSFYNKTPLVKLFIKNNYNNKNNYKNKNNIYFKLEGLQPSGSFKDRGISNMINKLKNENNVKLLISSSGGNAGHSVATIGYNLDIPVKVFVPTTTRQMMIDKLLLKGANVHIGGANWNEADQFARKALEEHEGSFYIPPYDHPLIWDGNSTIIDELVSDGIKPAAIVLSVGGGGLLRGIQIGLERHGWTDVKIIAIETTGTASYAAAYKAKKPVLLDKIDSIATSLGALSVTESTLTSSIETLPFVVTDKDSVEGILHFANDFRMLVEPACGASVITVYNDNMYQNIMNLINTNTNNNKNNDSNNDIVVIACGGSIVNLNLIETWKKQFEI